MKRGKQKLPSREIMWSVLPSEVEENILSRLPVKVLMRFRCVCKHWFNLVTNPYFIKLQLNRSSQIKECYKLARADLSKVYSIDVEACRNQYIKARGQKKAILQEELVLRDVGIFLDVVGSCNGLLCLNDLSNKLYLLNPATKEFIELPYPIDVCLCPIDSTPNAVFGFGYNHRTDEYKVLIIKYYRLGESHDVYVYTLGTNSSWRSIGSIEYKIEDPHHALVNGALHWMASDTPGFTVVLIFFYFGDEKFGELSLPKSFRQEDTNHSMGLVELDGFLSLYQRKYENFDIWAMKDYGDEQSWTKVFSVAHTVLPRIWEWSSPSIILKKDEEVLCQDGKD